VAWGEHKASLFTGIKPRVDGEQWRFESSTTLKFILNIMKKQTYLMTQSEINALVVTNAISMLKAIDIDGETTQFILEEVGMDDQMRSQLNATKQSWFEVFETDANGTTMTIASFDIKQDALAFVLSRPKGLGIDEWQMGADGIPHQVKEPVQKQNYRDAYGCYVMASMLPNADKMELDLNWERALRLYDKFIGSEFNDENKSEMDCIREFLEDRYTLRSSDYVLYDRGNNSLYKDSFGCIIVYDSREEAMADCYGNELVISCTQLPRDLMNELVKQINNA